MNLKLWARAEMRVQIHSRQTSGANSSSEQPFFNIIHRRLHKLRIGGLRPVNERYVDVTTTDSERLSRPVESALIL
jgi:hypothetical protein